MKMTPLEIRKKSFEKNFRGYDKDEVTAYLNAIAEELENLIEEKKDIQRKLDQSEKEGAKLKQVEESLFKTLKTAEDTGALIIEEANQAADQILKEARQNAESMNNDARSKSQNQMQNVEAKGKEIMVGLKKDVSAMVSSYETMVHQRDLVLKNLKKLAEDIDDQVSVSQNDFKKVNIQAHAQLVKDLENNNAFANEKIQENRQEPIEEAKTEKVPIAEIIKPRETTVPEEGKLQEDIQLQIEDKVKKDEQVKIVREPVAEKIPEKPEPVREFKALQSKAQEALLNFGMKERAVKEEPFKQPTAEEINKNKEEGSFFDQLD